MSIVSRLENRHLNFLHKKALERLPLGQGFSKILVAVTEWPKNSTSQCSIKSILSTIKSSGEGIHASHLIGQYQSRSYKPLHGIRYIPQWELKDAELPELIWTGSRQIAGISETFRVNTGAIPRITRSTQANLLQGRS